MPSTSESDARRFEPARFRKTLAYRPRTALPFAPDTVADGPILLDTTCYLDQLKADLPAAIVGLIAARELRHAAPALGEMAAALALLRPDDPRSAANAAVIESVLEAIHPLTIVAPTPAGWIEAAKLAGALARTQSLGRTERRRMLVDALIFVSAAECGATLISRNLHDFDLLSQLVPATRLLFYERASP